MRSLLNIIVLALFPTLFVQGQISRELVWDLETTVKGRTLSFDGAIYPETENMLPYFSETYTSTQFGVVSTSVTLQIDQQVYETVDIDLLTENQFAKIGKELFIQQSILNERGKFRTALRILPFRKQGNTLERLVSFSVHAVAATKNVPKKGANDIIPAQSVLAQGTWVKYEIPESGIYRFSRTDLLNMGFASPDRVAVYGEGGQLSFWNADTRSWGLQPKKVWWNNDNLYFFAQGANLWEWSDRHTMYLYKKNCYADKAYVFIGESNSAASNQITNKLTSGVATKTLTSYDVVAVHENDETNLIKSGRDWYGEYFDQETTKSFRFDLPELQLPSSCRVQVVMASRSKPASSFDISNAAFSSNLIVPAIAYNYESDFAKTDTLTQSFEWAELNSIPINIGFNQSSPIAVARLDYIYLNAKAKLKYNGNPFLLRNGLPATSSGVIAYQIESTKDLQVWDVTQNGNEQQLETKFDGLTVNFQTQASPNQKIIVFEATAAIPAPVRVGYVANQNLHGLPSAQMLIITNEGLLAQAQALADFHRNTDGLSVHVVLQSQIFNEFSSGRPDVSALRDFVRMFHLRANGNPAQMPKYLLLFGDGSYDNRTSDINTANNILTYQSKNSLYRTKSFVSDDFFGLLDANEGESFGALDIGIGRLPASNTLEADNFVTKIKQYYNKSTQGAWRNQVAFVADDSEDGDGHYFMTQSESMANTIWRDYPQFLPHKIYLDSYTQETTTQGGARYPEVNKALNEAVENGTLLINYVGHGSEYQLADEVILDIDQINNWSNLNNLTVFMTATCEFSRFDDYRITSAGERTIHNTKGGAVALFTTTRLVYAYPNELLNRAFFKHVLNKQNDEDNTTNRLGDILRRSKADVGTDDNKRNFTLLGDPALPLAIAKQNAQINTISGHIVSLENDTIRALQKVTIAGSIANTQGQQLTNFNGKLSAVLYDRPQPRSTKGNDYTAFDYLDYNNLIYKGTSTVTNGQFTFTFVVPKDIKYQYGPGRISLYAQANEYDAAGAHGRIIIGGSADNAETDNQGPQIDLYFNDENFISGGTTNETPILLAKLFDENGINSLGTAIGHDLEMYIDGNTTKKTKLNTFYQAELDQYQKGQVEYKLTDQPIGPHTLHFKAWDVYNNSSEATIDFLVTNSSSLQIERLFNYPNPFTSHTSFFFVHNRPFEELDVLIHIFSVSGALVKTIETTVASDGFLSQPIAWDGLDDFGSRIGRGVYFYQIRIRTPQGDIVEKYEKILVLK